MSDFTNKSTQSNSRGLISNKQPDSGALNSESGATIVDIVGKYDWANVTTAQRKKAPRITAHQFSLKLGGLANSYVKGYIEAASVDDTVGNVVSTLISNLDTNIQANFDQMRNRATNSSVNLDPYVGMYPVKDDKISWIFPYFTDTHTDHTSEWSDVDTEGENPFKFFGSLGAGVSKVLDGAGKIGTGVSAVSSTLADKNDNVAFSQSIGEDSIKSYDYNKSSHGNIDTSFILFNTINPEAASQNRKIINDLVRITKAEKITPYLVEPPKIFYVSIPGVRDLPFAVIGDLNVTKLGSTLYDNESKQNVPEAYGVTIRFVSLVPDTLNFIRE